MTTFYKTILKIFKTIKSKNDANPDLYMYETHTVVDNFNGCSDEIWDDYVCYTDLDKMEDAKSVYENYGADFRDNDADENRHLTATRTELFKITSDMLKEYFDAYSADEFYEQIPFDRIYTNNSDESFFEKDDLYIVYSDGDFFVGFEKKELEELIIMPDENYKIKTKKETKKKR